MRGRHDSIAVRITAHRTAVELCRSSGGLLVSTSANRSGRPPLRHYTQVRSEFGTALDFVVEKNVGNAKAASSIYDFTTGVMVRK